MREEGYQVISSNNGHDALHRFAEHRPNIVLSDVMMPGMNGFELCRELKTKPESVLTPVVLITALESSQDRIEGIQAGADEFLSKPINREELLARVRSLLRYQQTRKELEQAQRERLTGMFKRYMSPKLVDRVLEDQQSENIFDNKQERQHAVALFADLRGFTAMSETLHPAQVVALLNEFFSILTDAAYQYDGTIFNMAGDCLLIGFGVPLHVADAADKALAAAVAMQDAFKQSRKSWEQMYAGPIGLGIGINEGEMIVGNVGSPTYMNYTIIGDAVNVASRLTGQAKSGEIIFSDTIYGALGKTNRQLPITTLPPITLKGKAQAQTAYCIQLND